MSNHTSYAMGLTQLSPLTDNHSFIYHTEQAELRKMSSTFKNSPS